MSTGWNKNLETGIHIIDGQHREYFRRVDRFMNACVDGCKTETFDEMLAFIKNYVAHHFGTEEKLMTEETYPQLEAHVTQHRTFAAQLEKLAAHAREQSTVAESQAYFTLSSLLIDWFQNHIRRVDIKLTDFLKARQHPAVSG